MNNYYNNLSRYISYVVLPHILAHQILYLYKKEMLNISFLQLTNSIKKIINIRNINYQTVKYITNNILSTKYNYLIMKWRPITISYVIDK